VCTNVFVLPGFLKESCKSAIKTMLAMSMRINPCTIFLRKVQRKISHKIVTKCELERITTLCLFTTDSFVNPRTKAATFNLL
jgi:hypothetical protein